MQQFNGRPATRDRRENDNRRQFTSLEDQQGGERERRLSGEPAKYNTRTEQRRISWENDLYERQSI
ncbi:MAG TPA: hypothetical protein VGB71_08490 [Flavisolibacter sp.]|jgi:hypothetical protein